MPPPPALRCGAGDGDACEDDDDDCAVRLCQQRLFPPQLLPMLRSESIASISLKNTKQKLTVCLNRHDDDCWLLHDVDDGMCDLFSDVAVVVVVDVVVVVATNLPQ